MIQGKPTLSAFWKQHEITKLPALQWRTSSSCLLSSCWTGTHLHAITVCSHLSSLSICSTSKVRMCRLSNWCYNFSQRAENQQLEAELQGDEPKNNLSGSLAELLETSRFREWRQRWNVLFCFLHFLHLIFGVFVTFFLKLKMFFNLQSNLSHLRFFISFSCQFVHLYSFHLFAESR